MFCSDTMENYGKDEKGREETALWMVEEENQISQQVETMPVLGYCHMDSICFLMQNLQNGVTEYKVTEKGMPSISQKG